MTADVAACCSSSIGQPCAHKVVGVDSDAKAHVLRELASFAQYPPEENGRDGKCLWCDFPVEAHHGLVALGHDASGTFAGHLHRGCAAEIRRLQDLRAADTFRRTAPRWNCVDYADGMHYTPGDVCVWCGKTREQIANA